MRYTVACINRRAIAEGWVLSESDTYGLSLERDDDSDAFADDDEARAFVEKRAAAGSGLHKAALRLVAR